MSEVTPEKQRKRNMETVEMTNRNERSYSEKPNSLDSISRQAAIDAINCLIDRFEQILRDIRESKVDDSVCGICEYDGAFIGQSGNWCNECPGFDKEDCFKLSDECRKRWLKSVELPSAKSERKKGKWIHGREIAREMTGSAITAIIYESWQCSECEYIVEEERKPLWKFCPNCGADMRGEQDG